MIKTEFQKPETTTEAESSRSPDSSVEFTSEFQTQRPLDPEVSGFLKFIFMSILGQHKKLNCSCICARKQYVNFKSGSVMRLIDVYSLLWAR